MNTSCTDCRKCNLEITCSTNVFNKTKEIYAGQQAFIYSFEEYSRPTSMILSLTNDCNLRCPYCFVSQSPSKITLTTAIQAVEWLKSNYAAKGIQFVDGQKMTINFFGGEPLLCFEDIIKPLVEQYHEIVQFGITTNGTLLTPDVVDFFYKYHISPLLSFDGVEEVQNNQRPGKGFNSFVAIIDNLQYLLLRFPNIIMRATLTHDSIPFLYENVLMAEELGFRKVTFCPNAFEDWNDKDYNTLYNQLQQIGLHIYKKLQDPSQYPVIQVDPLVKKVDHIEKLMKNEIRFNNHIARCGLGTTSCAVTPDGRIIPCQEKTSNPTTVIGHVQHGINSEWHQKFLFNYWNKVNNITCDRLCSERERILCLSDTCPSRLEDQGFTFSTSICIFHKATTRAATRLHTLCSNSINSYIRNYFSGGVIC